MTLHVRTLSKQVSEAPEVGTEKDWDNEAPVGA